MAEDIRFIRVGGRVVPIRGKKSGNKPKPKRKTSANADFKKSNKVLQKSMRLESEASAGKKLGFSAGAIAGGFLGRKGGALGMVAGAAVGAFAGASLFKTDKKKQNKANILRKKSDKLHHRASVKRNK